MPSCLLIALATGIFSGCSSPDLKSRAASLEMPSNGDDLYALPRLVEKEQDPGRKNAASKARLKAFPETLKKVKKKQALLASLWSQASSTEEKDKIQKSARRFVVRTITNDILPAWQGTPWTMYAVKDGLKPDALVPHEKGKGTSCSYFVASVLVNAGLRLESRASFARAIALNIQRSLAPDSEDLHRFHKISSDKLDKKLLSLGPGLYLAGLNCHIGFIVVRDKKARFVHASYLEPYKVVDEAVAKSQAIKNSFKSGYVVTPLFQDQRLVQHWLEGKEVALEKFNAGKKGSKKK